VVVRVPTVVWGRDGATSMQLSVREAARLLSLSEKTSYRWVQQRKATGI
jgi:transposase